MKEASRYVLAYTLWAISLVMAALVGLIARDTFSNVMAVSAARVAGQDQRADFYTGLQLRAAEPWTYMILGIVLIIVFGVIENYYRTGVPEERLLPRFLLVTGIELGVLTLAHGTRLVISIINGWSILSGLALTLIELAVTGVFIWLYRRITLRKISI